MEAHVKSAGPHDLVFCQVTCAKASHFHWWVSQGVFFCDEQGGHEYADAQTWCRTIDTRDWSHLTEINKCDAVFAKLALQLVYEVVDLYEVLEVVDLLGSSKWSTFLSPRG